MIIFILYSHQAQPTQYLLVETFHKKPSHHSELCQANNILVYIENTRRTIMSSNVIIDAKNVMFCCGPCCSVDPEPEPTNHIDGPWYALKPHIRRDGKPHYKFVWPLPNNGELVVKNLRVCESCCSRYNDDEFSTDTRIRDGCVVMQKLKDYINE